MTSTTTTKPKCGAFLATQPRGNYSPGARRCSRSVEHEGDHCHLHGGPKVTGLQSTDLRDLARVRKRIEQLDRQAEAARDQRAALVRSLRAEMTLEQVAAHCGVSRQTVYQWVR